MPKDKDFIPRKDADYTAYFENIERIVDMRTHGSNPQWTHIPQAKAEALTETLNGWKNAYRPTLSPHTPEATREKNRVRASSEKYLRHFINQYLRYADEVSDMDRDLCGVPNEDPIRTPVETPVTSPAFGVEIAGPGRLRIRIHPEDTTRAAIPYGYHGAVVYWKILDHRPQDADELTHSELATRSLHTLYFKESDWGKKVYIALRWENESGREGPPSPIQESVIP
jgi:hypothetical protein